MKVVRLVILLLVFAPAAGWAQRSAATTTSRTETRMLPSFTAIDVTDGIQLVVRSGRAGEATVDASTAQFRRMIKTVVENSVLKVYFDYQHEPNWKGLVNSREEFKVIVVTSELRSLVAADGATVTLANGLAYGTPGALAVQLRSGARLAGTVQVARLDIQLRGGATARLVGAAATLQVRATEGSDFHSPKLAADQCVAFASSASSAQFTVHKTLDASAVNEATITYRGPAELTQERHEQGGKILHI